MLSVCKQYVKHLQYAEDFLLTGFLKVFTNLFQFKHEGSFEGWIRRIMVNTCISYLRKKNLVTLSDDDFIFNDAATDSLENTSVEDIQSLIDKIPEGYKMVFNLFAIEGFKYKEIAPKLGSLKAHRKHSYLEHENYYKRIILK
jgi:RNA polymerase sigma factor (sigma-70 family)